MVLRETVTKKIESKLYTEIPMAATAALAASGQKKGAFQAFKLYFIF